MRQSTFLVIGTLTGSLLWVVGCASTKPSRFYLLSAESSAQPTGATKELTLGMGPIEFPKYLDRPQIVTRVEGHRLELAEFDRWAEPLDQNFAQVMIENLSALLSTNNVVPYPWKRSIDVDYQITIDVDRFDAQLGEKTVLFARWTILDAQGSVVIPARASRIAEPMSAGNHGAYVQAASRAVERLSREIAAAIEELRTNRGPN